MENFIQTTITEEDLQVLISCLRSKMVRLTVAGDYPEKLRDEKVYDKLLSISYDLRKTGGELMVVSDE